MRAIGSSKRRAPLRSRGGDRVGVRGFVRIGAEIESVAASTKAAKVVNSEREEDNILVDKVLKHLLPRRGSHCRQTSAFQPRGVVVLR